MKSVKKLFNINISHRENIAKNQIIKHFKTLEFEIMKDQISYYLDKYRLNRNSKLDIVIKKKNKTIAIEVDNLNPRQRSIQKLNNYNADYKIIILRGPDRHYWIGKIEVISLPFIDEYLNY